MIKMISLVAIIIFCGTFVFVSAQVDLKKDTKKEITPVKKETKEKLVSYKKEVFQVIKKYCLPCHGEDSQNPSGLDLDSYNDMMKGGKHGKPIVPGKADSSILIMKLNTTPKFGEMMPLKAKRPLNKDEIKTISDWINQGAKKN